MSTIGRKLLSSIVYAGDVQTVIDMNLTPALFKDSENVLFGFISDHLKKYGKIPSPDTIEETSGLEDALVEAPEPADFYLEGVEKRYLQNTMKGFMNEAATLLKDDDKDPESAFDILLNGISTLNLHRRRILYDLHLRGGGRVGLLKAELIPDGNTKLRRTVSVRSNKRLQVADQTTLIR